MKKSACIITLSGYSGIGKTTLIENALHKLKHKGLYVGILKHVHHKLEFDHTGKDTDRLFKAGAKFVFAHDSENCFLRFSTHNKTIKDMLDQFPQGLDLIIIEGYKNSELPGIWLTKGFSSKGDNPSRKGNRDILYVDDPAYIDKFLKYIDMKLKEHYNNRDIKAGILIGGKSRRMGYPKALLEINGLTLVEKTFNVISGFADETVFLGTGIIPEGFKGSHCLPDVKGIEGPLAGMLSAFRWAPDSTWIISSVDMPLMNKEAWQWLLSQRMPGRWAVLPKLKGSMGIETTGSIYEPMIFEYIESLASKGVTMLQKIADHPKVASPVIPDSLESAWRNVNTLKDWKDLFI